MHLLHQLRRYTRFPLVERCGGGTFFYIRDSSAAAASSTQVVEISSTQQAEITSTTEDSTPDATSTGALSVQTDTDESTSQKALTLRTRLQVGQQLEAETVARQQAVVEAHRQLGQHLRHPLVRATHGKWMWEHTVHYCWHLLPFSNS